MNQPPNSSSRGMLVLLAILLAGLAVAMVFKTSRKRGGQDDPLIGVRPVGLIAKPLIVGTANVGDEPVDAAKLPGKVVVVNMWGPWCPPCRQELPHMAALATKLAGRDDFRMIAVSCNSPEPEQEVAKLREESLEALKSGRAMGMPVYYDPQGTFQLMMGELFGGLGYPSTLVLDKSGAIRGVWRGYSAGDERDLEALVNELLEAK